MVSLRLNPAGRRPLQVVAFLVSALGLTAFLGGVVLRPGLEAALGDGAVRLAVDLALYNLVYVAAAVCLFAATPGASSRERTGWSLVAWALLTSTAANTFYTVVLTRLPEVPYPSWADVGYLMWYPLIYVAIILLLTARVGRFPLSVWLDGVVAGTGAAAIAAAVWFQPLMAEDPSAPLLTVVISMGYPVADLLLVALLVGVGYIVRTVARGWIVLLGLGLLLTCLTDVVAAVQTVAGTYVEGGWLDVGWLAGVVALAAASLAPRTDSAVDALDLVIQTRGGSLRVMAVPLLSAGACLALLQLGQGDRFPPVAGVFAGVAIAAAGVRATLTFRDLSLLTNVHREARTDDLTGLANRRALYEAMETALALGEESGTPTSLLLVDLDGFKEVNDSLGHATGDDLLVAFARRMEATLPAGTMMARLGGDEFAILVPDSDTAGAVSLGWMLVESTGEPYDVRGVRLTVSLSIGVATLGPAGGTRGDLLRQADVAMYQAKGTTHRVSTFEVALGANGEEGGERLALLTRLTQGLSQSPSRMPGSGHLEMHIQPKVSLRDGRLEGVEALARWRDHDDRLLSPAEFLPLVRRGGLLPGLAAQVLQAGVKIGRRLAESGVPVPVSVNLSAIDIHDVGLPARVARLLEEEGVDARTLVVELTEDSLVADPEAAVAVLSELRAIGVRVSLDDFGTGYSSLAYLRGLPVDEVKLDRSFTLGIGVDPAADSVIAHTVGLVHALGLPLVAEGVEDGSTARRLAELGCDSGQGFLWARPALPEEFLGTPLARAFAAQGEIDEPALG